LSLRLTREVRARLFAGETPAITGSGPCAAEAGKTYALSPCVDIRILAVRRHRRGGWVLSYEIHDRRDVPRLLLRAPGIGDSDFEAIRESFDEYGYPEEPTADVLARAARESAYTSRASMSAITDAGEAIDERTQTKYTEEARTIDGLREQRRRERWELARQLVSLEQEAATRGVDITSHLRVIADRVARIEKQIRKAA
jgi:hypothetical protein